MALRQVHVKKRFMRDCVYCVDSVKGEKGIIIIQTCQVCVMQSFIPHDNFTTMK